MQTGNHWRWASKTSSLGTLVERSTGRKLVLQQLIQRMEVPVVVALFLGGSAFLLKMCYLSLAFNKMLALN
jgi:hypothetical protein